MNPFLIEHSEEELRLTVEFQRHLAAVSAITLKSFLAHRAEKEPEAKKGLQLNLKHQGRHCIASEANACFEVSLTMDVLADGDPAKPLFHIECVFELVCELDSKFSPTEEQLKAFERGNAVFVCWPYMREFVQNATGRLGISVPPIPPLRVTGKRQPAEQPKDNAPEPKQSKPRQRRASAPRSYAASF